MMSAARNANIIAAFIFLSNWPKGLQRQKKVKYCFPYDKVYEATQNALKRILCLAHISARTLDKQSRAELIKREK